MKPVWALAAALALFAAVPADAHGPTRQKQTIKIEIAKPVDQVWALVKDFDALAKWHPAIASSPATKGNEVGSVRTLTLKAAGDPRVDEEMLSYDDAAHTYHYEMKDHDTKILPFTNYTSWLTVKDNGGGSVVEWKGAYYRADQRNDPAPDQNDDAANAAVKAIYQGGLDNLKKIAEGK